MSKKKSRKKCIKVYRKTVVGVTHKLLKGTDNKDEIRIAGNIVCGMISSQSICLALMTKL